MKVNGTAVIKNKIQSNQYGSPRVIHLGNYFEGGKRHLFQQSEYLVPTIFEKEWKFISISECFEASNKNYEIFEIEVEGRSKPRIMKDLNDMNINRYTMYLDQDSLIKNLADEWALEDAGYQV